jgi:hypothetical protein
MRKIYKFFIGKREYKRHSEGLDIDGRITLEWISEKQGEKMWTGCIWLRIGTSGGLL